MTLCKWLGAIAVAATVATTARALPLLYEDFDDGSLDPRLSVSTVGTFIAAPGIKAMPAIAGGNSFGFGRSTNRYNSFYNYVTDLTITFDSPTFVSDVSFGEMELFDNWGSSGAVYADGNLIGPFWGFGRLPYNDRIADTSPRFHDFEVNQSVSRIVLEVHDITDLSEIYLDQLTVEAQPVPEPETSSLLALGLLLSGVAAMVRSRIGRRWQSRRGALG